MRVLRASADGARSTAADQSATLGRTISRSSARCRRAWTKCACALAGQEGPDSPSSSKIPRAPSAAEQRKAAGARINEAKEAMQARASTRAAAQLEAEAISRASSRRSAST